MEWVSRQCRNEQLEKEKATRIVTRFLYIPKTINCLSKWWVTVSFKQRMRYWIGGMTESGSYDWEDMEWI